MQSINHFLQYNLKSILCYFAYGTSQPHQWLLKFSLKVLINTIQQYVDPRHFALSTSCMFCRITDYWFVRTAFCTHLFHFPVEVLTFVIESLKCGVYTLFYLLLVGVITHICRSHVLIAPSLIEVCLTQVYTLILLKKTNQKYF